MTYAVLAGTGPAESPSRSSDCVATSRAIASRTSTGTPVELFVRQLRSRGRMCHRAGSSVDLRLEGLNEGRRRLRRLRRGTAALRRELDGREASTGSAAQHLEQAYD